MRIVLTECVEVKLLKICCSLPHGDKDRGSWDPWEANQAADQFFRPEADTDHRFFRDPHPEFFARF